MNDCDDKHLAHATTIGSIPEQREGKPSEAGNVKTRAEERVADEELD